MSSKALHVSSYLQILAYYSNIKPVSCTVPHIKFTGKSYDWALVRVTAPPPLWWGVLSIGWEVQSPPLPLCAGLAGCGYPPGMVGPACRFPYSDLNPSVKLRYSPSMGGSCGVGMRYLGGVHWDVPVQRVQRSWLDSCGAAFSSVRLPFSLGLVSGRRPCFSSL